VGVDDVGNAGRAGATATKAAPARKSRRSIFMQLLLSPKTPKNGLEIATGLGPGAAARRVEGLATDRRSQRRGGGLFLACFQAIFRGFWRVLVLLVLFGLP